MLAIDANRLIVKKKFDNKKGINAHVACVSKSFNYVNHEK